MEQNKTVEEYILKHQNRQKELDLLRGIILSCGLEETIKWGSPCYTHDGKNVVGIAAFKSYVGLWFHNGVFLKDPKKVLVNAQEGTTKALRQWRFNSIEEINKELVKQYVLEAKANQEAGKELKPVKAKKVDIPKELTAALSNDRKLEEKFKSLSPGKQREYAEYIGQAKQETTRIKRLKKSIPIILEGKGLNDQYR